MDRRWRNPSDVMRMRRKKRRSSTQKPDLASTATSDKENSCSPLSSISLTSSGPRVNGREGKKMSLALRAENTPSSPLHTKRTANSRNEDLTPHAKKLRSTQFLDITNNQTGADKATAPVEASSQSCGEKSFPLDWCLRMKARFTSPLPFTWASSTKTHHEAHGVASFVRGAERETLELQSELRSHLLVWTHPSLPFLRLYPRMDTRLIPGGFSATQGSVTAVTSLLQDDHILQSLKDDWATSFQSLFHLLRTGLCPYFYVCANGFTALFRASGVGSCPQPTALLTPTTSGLRQALRSAGVELSLPLDPESPPKSEETASLDDSEAEDDSSASNWLQSMGLHLHDNPGLPEKIALQKVRSVSIDNHPESVVMVAGSHLRALVNFLLTSKVTVAATGALAGVPPTLLAPTAFEGASLKALKVKQGTIQEHMAGQLTRQHYLDVLGPILPCTLHGLCGLMQRTQNGNFTVQFNCNESTIAFNCDETTKDPSHQTADSTPPDHSDNSPHSLRKSTLRELKSTDSFYTWLV